MLLPDRPWPKPSCARLPYRHAGALLLIAGAFALPGIAMAQAEPTPPSEQPASILAEGQQVAFEADGLMTLTGDRAVFDRFAGFFNLPEKALV